MYELSRAMFRALNHGLLPDPRSPGRPARILLGFCEETVALVAQTPSTRRLHARRLFARTRALFAPADQLALLDRIESTIDDVHQQLVARTTGRTGGLLRCAASTRRNTPCMREPVPGRRYCPSHRHLEAATAALAATAD